MLFQASDWAFMIHSRSADGYARSRLAEHCQNACSLFALASSPQKLKPLFERSNNTFSWL